MARKVNGNVQRTQKLNLIQGEGPNWVIIAGGALLSTLLIRLGCKLKQAFEAKRSNNGNNAGKENGKSVAKRKPGACELHPYLYCLSHDEDGCYRCFSGIQNGAIDIKRPPVTPMSMDADLSLPLVKIPTAESNKENNTMMCAPSPDRLELPPSKPFRHSIGSDSPCISETGSDIFSKREVIQKLRQQLKRRDEMIMEMHSQITDLRNSLSIQTTYSARLESQLDSANRDLFDSDREIQRLRKAIADHCVSEAVSHEKPATMTTTRVWRPEAAMNGYRHHSMDDVELECVGEEKARGDREPVEMSREVQEVKQVIEGKEMLLGSYKMQKVGLSLQVKEQQPRH